MSTFERFTVHLEDTDSEVDSIIVSEFIIRLVVAGDSFKSSVDSMMDIDNEYFESMVNLLVIRGSASVEGKTVGNSVPIGIIVGFSSSEVIAVDEVVD